MPNLRLDIPDNPFGRGFREPLDIKGFGINLRRDILGGSETALVVKELSGFVNLHTARTVTTIVADLLSTAQPRVPVDTGKLRRSGTAYLQFGNSIRTVAKGQKDGTVDVSPGRVTHWDIKNARYIAGNVDYERQSDDGKKDVAIFTHEYLNPYESKERPRAKTPGTGPKYLESAWNERKGDYIDYLYRELYGIGFDTALGQVLVKRTKKLGNYTLYYNKIVLSRLSRPPRFKGFYRNKAY